MKTRELESMKYLDIKIVETDKRNGNEGFRTRNLWSSAAYRVSERTKQRYVVSFQQDQNKLYIIRVR